MSWAAMRLVIISLGTIITLGLAVFAVRTVALKAKPPLALLPKAWSAKPKWILTPFNQEQPEIKPYSRESLDRICNHGAEDLIPVIELRPSKDRIWFVAGADHKTVVETLDASSLEAEGLIPLAKVAELCRSMTIALKINSREPQGAASLHEQAKNLAPRIPLVLSTYQGPLVALRKIEPHWLFAMDPSTFLRWRLLSSLGLEVIARMDFDVVMVPVISGSLAHAHDRLIAEILRRNLPLVIEWSESPSLDEWAAHARGVYGTSPSRARKLFQSAPRS